MKKSVVLAILLAGAVPACSPGVPPVSVGERFAADGSFDEIYRLGPDDKVRIIVYNEPQLSGDFSISGVGDIALPLIGNVPVEGKTTRQASDLVQQRLADGYLRDPRVSMEVATYRPFFILGEVRAPGQYPYAPGMTVMNAIATAEGMTPRAQPQWVMIRRFGEIYETKFKLTPDLQAYPGDTIRLAERFF